MPATPLQPSADDPGGVLESGDPNPLEGVEVGEPLRPDRGTRSHAGVDRASGEHLVLKRIGSPPSGLASRLAYETEALSHASADRWVTYDRVGSDGEGLVLVRPHVEGESLADRLEEGPLDLDEALALFDRVLDALEQGHRHGVLHRALRPSNLLLEAGQGERVLLVDGGLHSVLDDGVPSGAASAGLAVFTSPEQAGLIEHEVGEWSDLYLAGLVLYTALAGEPPFKADGFGATLRQHITAERPSLREAGVDVPRAVDHMLHRMLKETPRERYRSVQGVRTDLDALREALDRGESDPEIVIGARDKRANLTEPGFIGRQSELEALASLLETTHEGQGGVVRLEAESGGGKTRLLDEFAEMGALSGAWVLRGQGLDAAAQRPFQILKGIADGVAQRMNHDPRFRQRLTEHLGEHRRTVAEVVPELRDPLDVDAAEALGPEEYGEIRTIQALTRLLEGLTLADEPALLLIDDAQWADPLSKRLILHWSRERDRDTPVGALMVVSFRVEEVPPGDRLRQVEPLGELTLDPFQPEDVSRLVESMAGPVPEPALDIVVRLAQGNPFMASAVLRGLVESGALEPGADGAWHVDDSMITEAEASRHAASFLLRRFELLSRKAQRILEVGAVLGKRFELPMAAALADVTAGRALSELEPARKRRVIWPSDEPGHYQFAHDKLREAVLEDLDEDRRRRLHRKAAAYLEAHAPDRSYELAYHHDEAGQPDRALEHALPAAEQARSRYALSVAEQYYRIAERGVAHDDRETRYRIHQGLGEVLMLAGDYEAARQQLDEALPLARDRDDEVETRGALGELAFKRGDMATSAKQVEAALRKLGERVPGSTLGYALLLVWEVLVQTLHSLAPSVSTGNRTTEDAEDILRATRLYSRLTYVSWYHKGPLPTLWAHLREMKLAERVEPTSERSQAYAAHAPVMTQLPWYSRGEAYCRRAIEIAQDVEDPYAEGAARHFLGLVLYAATDYEAALETLRRGETLLERTGDRWQANNASFHISFCLYRLGHLEEAVEKAKDVYATAREIGDLSTLGLALEAWAKASDGDIPAELVERGLEDIPEDDAQTYEAALQAKAIRLLSKGKPEASLDALEEAEAVANGAGLRSEYVAPIGCWKATALRRMAQRTGELAPDRREDLLERAARTALGASFTARFFKNNRPHALRERGLIALMRGRRRPGRRWLEKSLEAANAQGARVEVARTRVALARANVQAGDAEARARLAAARKELDALVPGSESRRPTGDEPTLSLADRFSTLIRSGHRIASSLDPESILAATGDAASSLLRGQHAAVFSVSDGGDPEAIVGDLPIPAPTSLMREALEYGAPLAVSVARGDVVDRTLVDHDVASALCAPIRVEDAGRYAVVVLHRDVEGLYDEDDVQIASFLATIAGAALESAENYRRLAELNATLEERVDERTSELEARTSELEEALSLHEAILDATGDGILVVDRNQNVTAFNDQFQQMWDIPDEIVETGDDDAMIAHVLDQLKNPQDFMERVKELYADPTATGRDVIEFKDGRIYERYAHPQRLDGEIVGRVWSFHDVTEQRETKRDLERSNAELERFAYVASHDLQEPLRMVHSYVQLLESRYADELDDSADEIIGYAVEGAERMRTLIRDLLAFSRVDTQARPLEPTNLDDVVDEALAALEMSVDEMGARIEREPMPTVLGDAGQLRHVLQNLVSNAMKFHPDDKQPRVRIRAQRDNDRWAISVEDDGIGIDPEYHDRIFDAFKRLHRHDEISGTGIGLAICQKVVERHDGEIWVDSQPGEGSCFTFTLPVVGESDADA